MAYEDDGYFVCDHPVNERATVTYADAGYLNVPDGLREVCCGCGWDFGPADGPLDFTEARWVGHPFEFFEGVN